MASSYKMKGIFKGLKVISQIFAAKEHEMEIGSPTDVKHVAHIGWNSSAPPLAGNASPSWMDGFRGSTDYSSLGNFAAPSTGTSWASQDFDQPQDRSSLGMVSEIAAGQDAAAAVAAAPCPGVPRPPPGKTRRRGRKATATAASTEPTTSTPAEDRPSLTPASPAAAADADGTQ